MATQYVLTQPLLALSPKTVLMIDLCPQANVSMALIGRENVDYLTSQRTTISFYLRDLSSCCELSTINLLAFLTQVNGFNNKIYTKSLVHGNLRGMRTLQI